MKNVLVTGCTGFIGGALVSLLARRGDLCVTACVRKEANLWDASIKQVVCPDIGQKTGWQWALRNVTHVIHLAGVATEPARETGIGSIYQRVNVEGTLNLARQATAAGIKRFVFISSIKVNGEWTVVGQPFTHDQKLTPQDAYGVSKYEAEKGLARLANETGMEVTVIRPPLVYGPGVKANFRSMMAWINKGYPLPLGAIHNQRSLVALGNLVDLIVTCIDHPAAANEIFLVSDGEDLSTTELLHRMGQALGKPARLLPVPAWFIEIGATVLGKKAIAQRLCGNLQVDISHTCNTLGWTPPLNVDEALKQTAEAYLASVSKEVKG